MTYTTTLMDKLEQTKADNPENDAITDDTAGQAYVEQFGLDTFQRADNAIQANKVTRQTADTLLAAATFLDLSNIWGDVDPEIASKIKYAKFHALRIAKALKAGEDPNLSNPQPDPSPSREAPLDPSDPDVQRLNAASSEHHQSRAGPQNPSVEEVPDENDRVQAHLAPQSTFDQSLHPSRDSSIPRPISTPSPTLPSPPDDPRNFYNSNSKADNDEVSPLEETPPDRRDSTGGGYFPTVPTSTSQYDQRRGPDAPVDQTMTGINQGHPSLPEAPDFAPSASRNPSHPPLHYQPPQQPHDFLPPHVSHPPPEPQRPGPSQPTPNVRRQPSYPPQFRSTYETQPPPAHDAAIPPAQVRPTNRVAQYNTSEEAIADAQKHARWAISALNFEDVKTAVQELHVALKTLGAE